MMIDVWAHFGVITALLSSPMLDEFSLYIAAEQMLYTTWDRYDIRPILAILQARSGEIFYFAALPLFISDAEFVGRDENIISYTDSFEGYFVTFRGTRPADIRFRRALASFISRLVLWIWASLTYCLPFFSRRAMRIIMLSHSAFTYSAHSLSLRFDIFAWWWYCAWFGIIGVSIGGHVEKQIGFTIGLT